MDPLGLFEGVLGTLKSLYRVYSRYLGIPGLRATVGSLSVGSFKGSSLRL